jgi:hypothetical protein
MPLLLKNCAGTLASLIRWLNAVFRRRWCDDDLDNRDGSGDLPSRSKREQVFQPAHTYPKNRPIPAQVRQVSAAPYSLASVLAGRARFNFPRVEVPAENLSYQSSYVQGDDSRSQKPLIRTGTMAEGGGESSLTERVGQLHVAHREEIFRFPGRPRDACKGAAQDMTQEVFVMWLATLRDGSTVTSERACLYRVAASRAVDYGRRERRPILMELDAENTLYRDVAVRGNAAG